MKLPSLQGHCGYCNIYQLTLGRFHSLVLADYSYSLHVAVDVVPHAGKVAEIANIPNFLCLIAGLGSILDTVSKDTEDTAPLVSVSYIHFNQLLLMVSVSKYLKDTEDTAP